MFYGEIAVKNFLKLCAMFVCRCWIHSVMGIQSEKSYFGEAKSEKKNGQGVLSLCYIEIVSMETSVCSVAIVAVSPVHYHQNP